MHGAFSVSGPVRRVLCTSSFGSHCSLGGSFYHPVFHLRRVPNRGEVKKGLRFPQLANDRELSPGLLALESACNPWAVCQGSQGYFVVCIILIFMVLFFLMIHDTGFPFKGVMHVLFPLKTK